MPEQPEANKQWRSGALARRTLPALALALAAWALVGAFFAVDVTEYALVTRFGRVVRVVSEPGLHVTAPFDRVVRLDRRLRFSRPERSEYLTTDKKNVVVESLITWQIADPERFFASLATPATADERLSDLILSESGSVIGRHPASHLISTDPGETRYRAIVSEIGRRVADFAGPAVGEHVFDRMKAERARIAKENRSAGELEAKKLIAEADHEKTVIDADATGQAERIRAEGDAEASRTYAAAFAQDPRFYQFLRTLRAYDKLLDDKTTLFLPADTEVLRMLRFDTQSATEPSTPAAQGFSAGSNLLLKKKPEEGPR